MRDQDDFRRPIIKNRTRVFRPFEVDKILRYGTLKLDHKTMFRALLYTGMRYVELQRFQKEPDWFDGDFIHLPYMKAERKAKRRQRGRWVRLNNQGKMIIEQFLDLDRKLPNYDGWNKNLQCWCRRAEVDPEGVSVKSTRKTWESWLLFVYPTRIMDIVGSQGHTTTISIQHYCNMPFTKADEVSIVKYVEGWI